MSTYSDPDRLDDLMLREGADIRSPLLRTLVDLYLQKPTHSAEETQHFTELTLRLLDQADRDTCSAIARRLAAYPSVPAAIARRLAAAIPDAPAQREPTAVRAATKPPPPAPVRASATELSELFFAASSTERRLILANLAYAPGPAPTFTGDAREAARQIETAALAHNPDAFTRALERWLGVAPTLARSIATDPHGEPMIVAAKALGIAPDAVQRILLFVNPVISRSVSRVHDLARLFETIDREAAQVLVAIWRAAEPRAAARPPQPEASERGVRRTSAPRTVVMQRNPGDPSPRAVGGKR